MSASVGVIICAAGKGTRAGFRENKLFAPLQGGCVIERTLSAFSGLEIAQTVVTSSAEDFSRMQTLCAPFGAQVVLGGETRAESVYNALQTMTTDIVLIHDGARPFVTKTIIQNCIDSVLQHGSGICALPCTDTMAVKCTTEQIVRVPERNLLARLQTPQGFYLKDILNAYRQAFTTGKLYEATITDEQGKTKKQTVQTRKASQYTDDSSIYLDFIGFPHLCDGAEENVKLTYPRDFQSAVRCGVGIDTHAFGKEQEYITLAGVRIPSESGLIAHSDGDVLVHALMDAMLSACGLKDIGHYFPDTDNKWKDANSMTMLAQVKQMLAERGYGVQNASIAIQAEKPRLAKYIDGMKDSLANALGVGASTIGITAGTCEGLGFVGAGKGITVTCYVLLKEI